MNAHHQTSAPRAILSAWLAALLVLSGAACSGSKSAASRKNAGDSGPDPFGNNTATAARDGSLIDSSTGYVVRQDCGTSTFDASPMPVNVLLVIDRSGSMSSRPTGFSTDKWSAMKASLSASLQAVQDQLLLGLELFPIDDKCQVRAGPEVDVGLRPGAQAVPLIQAALDHATPSGGTPTAGALGQALDYLTKGGGKDFAGEKYVLLATDGGPNCNSGLTCDAAACTVNTDGQCPGAVTNCCDESMAGAGAQSGCLDDQGTLAQIKALSDAGIGTFVVGIPGSESYKATLDALAQAGGHANPSPPPSYYAVSASGTGVGGLTSVLGTITSSLIKTCRLQLVSTPPALEKLNVQLDDAFVPQAGADGWDLDISTNPPTIVLKGKTCDRLEMTGVMSIKVIYGCPTMVK